MPSFEVGRDSSKSFHPYRNKASTTPNANECFVHTKNVRLMYENWIRVSSFFHFPPVVATSALNVHSALLKLIVHYCYGPIKAFSVGMTQLWKRALLLCSKSVTLSLLSKLRHLPTTAWCQTPPSSHLFHSLYSDRMRILDV